MLAADWQSQTHMKNYHTVMFFSCMEMQFFSVVKIPIKHSSLYNNIMISLPEAFCYNIGNDCKDNVTYRSI